MERRLVNYVLSCVAEWGWGRGGRHHCELCVVRGGGADGFLNCVVGGGGGGRFY